MSAVVAEAASLECVLTPGQRIATRAFDLVVAAVITVLLLPVIMVLAVLVKLDSPGPVFFLQERVGQNGRLFKMFKFRSMVQNAAQLQSEVNVVREDGKIIHKQENDPRVTRIGQFLRRWTLDELPQLFNVLKGDLSLVGPRPEMPWLVETYDAWQFERFKAPQGVTGWWQINRRADQPMHLSTKDDLYYVENYSLWLDIKILLRTPLAVIRGVGAY